MASPFFTPSVVRKFASTILLLLILFQLGACPCGCAEHNAWLQMMGMDHHHVDDPIASSRTAIQEADHHDCTGEKAKPYLDNARVVRCGCESLSTPSAIPSHNLPALASTSDPTVFRWSQGAHTYARAPDLSSLQVFQL